ncbi:MAG TPA: ChaN family lipoprotein [Candidatus Sulfotelmatobacter sp.]|nr:ChaN family lipoprotein [Candidatus Sulfotelmatobacter sp.]
MASNTNLRFRRSAAQMHALAGVEREIRSQDSHNRRKYLRDFNQAFRSYECLLDSAQFQAALHSADVVLVGDYHALPAAQRYAAQLIEQRAMAGDRPVVLGVETVFARDQHIVDEWWRREIDDSELRQRIRFDLDWGYDWAPFYELLSTARDHGEALYGLDCMPREDLRKIGARDRHAAAKLAEIRQRHPNAVIFVLFGESHLAPGHLPRELERAIPGARVLTVLQNIDSLYWRAAGERAEKIEAVRVKEDVLCVFNATPLEKYENYRLFLDQWSRCDTGPDFGPTMYNLIDSLASFLEINRYSPHNGTQPKFLVDLLPEVYGGSSDAMVRRLLSRKGVSELLIDAMLDRVEESGSAYVPQVNAFYVRELQMMHAAENATRFLHHACQGLPQRLNGQSAVETENESGLLNPTVDSFYFLVIEHAVAFFGSRLLYPSRPAPEFDDSVQLSRAACEKAAQAAAESAGRQADESAREWGYRIGNQIYEAYLAGKVAPGILRRLFLAHLDKPGEARKVCAAVIARLRSIGNLPSNRAVRN